MAKQRPSVLKRQREHLKRQREQKKAERALQKRERRLNREQNGPEPAVTVDADGVPIMNASVPRAAEGDAVDSVA